MTLRVEWLEEIRLRLHVVDLIPHGQTCNGAHVRLPGGVSLDFFFVIFRPRFRISGMVERCSWIHTNPHVLRWIGVKLELNSTPTHTNTYGLK